MKAIETRYKGYRFRSRLEARWAVFFDTFTLDPAVFRWEYEPQGFHLSNGMQYLPDFRVSAPNKGVIAWYEVKPFAGADDGKMGVFARDFRRDFSEDNDPYEMTNATFAVLSGDPLEFLGADGWKRVCPRCGSVHMEEIGDEWGRFYCQACDFATPCGGDQPMEFGVTMATIYPSKGAVVCEHKDLDVHIMTVKHACQRARSARFEHGECG